MPGLFELWMDPKVAKGIQAGQDVVFKTDGSFFLMFVLSCVGLLLSSQFSFLFIFSDLRHIM